MNEEAIEVLKEMGLCGSECHVDRIEVTSCGSEPDPDWKYTDQQGHQHWYHKREDDPWDTYPTLTWITDIPATEDCPRSGHYECAACGEEIGPGLRSTNPGGMRQYVPGQATATLIFRDGKIYCTGDEIAELQRLCDEKYDYGFTKLRAFIQKLKDDPHRWVGEFRSTMPPMRGS